MINKLPITASSLILLSSVWSASTFAEDANYNVKVTNLTRGQVFTPILVTTHKEGLKAFNLGQPAIPEITAIAESGNTEPAITALTSLIPGNLVKEAKDSGGVLPPGQSTMVAITGGDDFTHITLLSMLIPTNDAFFAVNGLPLPEGDDPVTYRSVAYDAGSEENDELCTNIPGPPDVCSGEGLSEADGEGFVHVHAGIHGSGDLTAAQYDWRNPVAEITIQRVDP